MGYFPITLAGTGYMVDLDGYTSTTLETIRQQADDSDELGERSLNPNDLWRRSADSWKLGAGQTWFDLKTRESSRERFNESSGITPWEEGEISLLEDTRVVGAITLPENNGQTIMVSANNRVLHLRFGSTTIHWRADSGSTGAWSSATLPDLGTGWGLTSNGFRAYVFTDVGIYRIEVAGGISFLKINNLTADTTAANPQAIGFVKGRLMVGTASTTAGNALYNIIDDTGADLTVPTPLAETTSVSIGWTTFGPGDSHIYAARKSGDSSFIDRITIREDGTALTGPVQAAHLPNNEFVYSIVNYVGVVVLGTSDGIRLAVAGANGELFYGPLIETPGTVFTIEPDGQFIWFGYTDTNRSGLGRIDLREFTQNLTPAYTTDLMVATIGTNTVWSALAFDGNMLFGIQDNGVFARSINKVSSGTISSGKITFDLADNKVFERFLIKTDPMPAGSSIGVRVDVDGTECCNATLNAGDFATGGLGGEFKIRDVNGDPPVGQYAEAILTLNRATDTTISPVITRWTLRANPIPRKGDEWVLPLILEEEITDLNGNRVHFTPLSEVEKLRDIVITGEPVAFIEFGITRTVYVDRIQFGGGENNLRYNKDRDSLQGRCFVQLRSFQ